jgi:GntR family transcriptional regulator
VKELRSVDPTSDRPVYKQIADILRDAVVGGELAPGDQLPSESELVDRFGVSNGTIRKSLGLLRGEGLVVAEHGRGVYVRTRPKVRRLAYDRFSRSHRQAGKAAYLVEAEAEGVTPDVEVYYVGPENATSEVAERLGVKPGVKLLARKRRYLSDGRPTELAESFIPWALAEGTAMVEVNTGPGGIYARLEDRGHRLDHYTEDVTSRMPTPDEARALRLSAGTPVFRLVRVAYTTEGLAVEVCDTVMSSDEYVLSYRLPAD